MYEKGLDQLGHLVVAGLQQRDPNLVHHHYLSWGRYHVRIHGTLGGCGITIYHHREDYWLVEFHPIASGCLGLLFRPAPFSDFTVHRLVDEVLKDSGEGITERRWFDFLAQIEPLARD